MAVVNVIEGEIFRDYRGQISSVNGCDLSGVVRTYFIHHPDVSIIRGWHAHRYERKWFYCVKGAFRLNLVEIDNWDEPSPDLVAQTFDLRESNSKMICVPAGFGNWIQALEPDSILMVGSDKTFAESANDSYRFDCKKWVNPEYLM